ncbi:MAG: FecR family protein [Kofleriaceae bacterium]
MTPVDPLNDAAWARVEKNVWTTLDAMPDAAPTPPKRSRTWLLAIPAVAVAAILAFVLWPSHTPPAYARITSEAAPSTVALADAHITLEPYSAIVTEPSHTLVESGAAWFDVEPRTGRAPFVVVAGDVRVRVIGTHFRVARSAEVVEVSVERGLVEIGYHGDTVQLGRGGHWSTETIATVLPDPTPTTPITPVPPTVPTPPVVTPPPPAIDHDAHRFAELTKLEPSDPTRAMAGYLELSKKSGTWAAVSLFAAARLAVDRHDPRATSLLQIYLKRFPRGANAADAQDLLNRLQGAAR